MNLGNEVDRLDARITELKHVVFELLEIIDLLHHVSPDHEKIQEKIRDVSSKDDLL